MKQCSVFSKRLGGTWNNTSEEKAIAFSDERLFTAVGVWKGAADLQFIVYGQHADLGGYLLKRVRAVANTSTRSTQNVGIEKMIQDYSFKKIKPGGFGLVFSSVRLMHRLMVDLEDSGFLIKDVLFWSYLNGMPKSRNVGLLIDSELNIESEKVGEYKYVQGYKKMASVTIRCKKNINYLLVLSWEKNMMEQAWD